MSQLTRSLMGERRNGRSSKSSALLAEVTDRLVNSYGTPSLGNFRDPVKEIFYILLSARTSETLYRRAHSQLFSRFPTLEALSKAKTREVLQAIRVAGLGKKRATQVLAIAARLSSDLGADPRRRLRRMTGEDSYRYLTSLPGVGPKSAFCVMMCSLNHDVFPVDINVQRIMERLGIISGGLKHYEAQRLAPQYVPQGRSKELHVGLLEHGRKVCLPNRPKCDVCVLADICRHGRRVWKASAQGSCDLI